MTEQDCELAWLGLWQAQTWEELVSWVDTWVGVVPELGELGEFGRAYAVILAALLVRRIDALDPGGYPHEELQAALDCESVLRSVPSGPPL